MIKLSMRRIRINHHNKCVFTHFVIVNSAIITVHTISTGKVPFEDLSDDQVIEFINEGKLKKPSSCTRDM